LTLPTAASAGMASRAKVPLASPHLGTAVAALLRATDGALKNARTVSVNAIRHFRLRMVMLCSEVTTPRSWGVQAASEAERRFWWRVSEWPYLVRLGLRRGQDADAVRGGEFCEADRVGWDGIR
jgi:hypothetical protein